MLQPNDEQLALLTPLERFAYRLGDLASRHSNIVAPINDTVMRVMIGACSSRRLHVHGLEHLSRFGGRDSLLFVCNHRSFYDFYLVSATLFWHTDLPRRMFFPVRATFFYDHPLGPITNLAMSGMRMFPPFLRERERGAFNLFSVARAIAELEVPGTIMGIHPEGTRSKGADPYALLPPQSGVGKIALEARRSHVIPVFVHGLSNGIHTELARNIASPHTRPLDVSFGAEIDLADLRADKPRIVNQKRTADRCMQAIAHLAAAHRARAQTADASHAHVFFDHAAGAAHVNGHANGHARSH